MKNELLTRRVAKVLPSAEELDKVLKGKKVRLYIGVDPTGSQLHLGHTIGLRKLMEFAEAGHEAILLFGTGTVLVGDPSLRDSARALIKEEEIKANMKTWQEQVSPIVDFDKVKIMYNGDWLTKMTLADIVAVSSNVSAVQLFKRESFTRRLEKGDTVWYHETMYPLLQGYDSVAMDVDLEIGGTDQEFNMLMGRELQKKINDRDKYVLTTPMILGTDGKQMSKTSGNCIWIADDANDMYGKLMSMHDQQIEAYADLVSSMTAAEVAEIAKELKGGVNPRDVKAKVAMHITSEYRGEKAAKAAAEAFTAQFADKQLPDNIPEYQAQAEDSLQTILVNSGLATSNNEAKTLITQGSVRINQAKAAADAKVSDQDVIQVGKRRFIKIKL